MIERERERERMRRSRDKDNATREKEARGGQTVEGDRGGRNDGGLRGRSIYLCLLSHHRWRLKPAAFCKVYLYFCTVNMSVNGISVQLLLN